MERRKKIREKHLPNYWISEEFNYYINEILEKIYTYYCNNLRNIKEEELLNIDIKKLKKINKDEIITLLRGFNE